MSQKITQGPWKYFEDNHGHIFIKDASHDLHIAYLGTVRIQSDTGQRSEANAKLIASAPELLSALQEIESNWSKLGGVTGDQIAVARSAIAKATGDAP